MMQLRKASKGQAFLRLALQGPSGTGKSFTALRLAHALRDRLAPGTEIGAIDTENGSLEKYQGERNPDGGVFDLSVIDLSRERGKYSIDNYITALHALRAGGVKVGIVDSLSHAWAGAGGALEQVDRVAGGGKGNKYTAWAEVTPKQNALIEALLSYPGHLLITLRTKTEYILEEKNGKQVPKRVGTGAIQREGVDYEFDVVGEVDHRHGITFTKSRIPELQDQYMLLAGAELADLLVAWRDRRAGAPTEEQDEPAPQPPAEQDEPEPTPTATHRKLTLETLNAATGLGIESLDVYQGFIVERANGRPVTPILERGPHEVVTLARSLGTDGNITRLRGYVAMLERQRAEREQEGAA